MEKDYCAIERFYPLPEMTIKTSRDSSRLASPKLSRYDKSSMPAKVISLEEFQQACQRAVTSNPKPRGHYSTLQVFKQPALDALYKVIYMENKLPSK